MAVTILIKQSGFFKKTIKLSTLKKLAGNDFICGSRDNTVYAFDEYTQEDIIGVDIAMQNPKRLGRGFIVCAGQDKSIELILNMPCTSQDITDYYNFANRICYYLGVKEFKQDDEMLHVSSIDSAKHAMQEWNTEVLENSLKQIADNTFVVFGASYPVYIEHEVADHLRTLKGEELEAAFANYIDAKQQIDCYYMKPNFYRNTNDILGVYALTEEVDSIIPMKSYIPFNSGLAENAVIDRWLIALVVQTGNTYDSIGNLNYADFLEHVPQELLTKYDQSHWIIKGLTRKHIDSLLNYQVEL